MTDVSISCSGKRIMKIPLRLQVSLKQIRLVGDNEFVLGCLKREDRSCCVHLA